MIQFAANQHMHHITASDFSFDQTAEVRRLHRMLPVYAETPLARLNQSVYVKDESGRFGIKAFKGLGGIYAMFRMICREFSLNPLETTIDMLKESPFRDRIRSMEFVTTTDGNHGKGVSWAAGILGCRAHVYLPKGTVEARAQAIRDAGNADASITDLRYDDCVAWTMKLAEERGWYLIQDTSGPGYEEVPRWIMQGYTTLFYEAISQMKERPTHIFLQAGVGALAGAIAAAAVETYPEHPPVIATVEPREAACFYESFEKADGLPHAAAGSGETIMAGLNCAVPCVLAWDILNGCAMGGFVCDDEMACHGMRLLRKAGITAGESGAVTAGLVDLLMRNPAYAEMRKQLHLNEDSVILLINTEGDTDPENYQRIIAQADEADS
ncbi:MAG: diaminopropionate ammonia-lyase [Clostridia bacterium]|nr:diaminopropionate ammonia-lyase [Clostridia bacterium]